jgi:hypothetical protein
MTLDQLTQIDTSMIDTIEVINYCHLGVRCPNHNHGIIDTTFYFVPKLVVGKSYRKLTSDEVDISVNCENLYIDIFGNIFYIEPEVKQIENVMEQAKLTSFDSIKVGDKVFPAATPFVPKYFTHAEAPMPTHNTTEMFYDVTCFTVLVLLTIVVATNNAWSKLWNEIITA